MLGNVYNKLQTLYMRFLFKIMFKVNVKKYVDKQNIISVDFFNKKN